EAARVEGRGALPTWREYWSERRWGPRPALSTAPPVAETAKESLREQIVALNTELARRHGEDEATKSKVAEFAAQLQVLEGRTTP
ncbi:MAG TPA: hypothetical protein VKZ50_02725, partial [bacterium]|nr:hypothetical protein [bacterium]